MDAKMTQLPGNKGPRLPADVGREEIHYCTYIGCAYICVFMLIIYMYISYTSVCICIQHVEGVYTCVYIYRESGISLNISINIYYSLYIYKYQHE